MSKLDAVLQDPEAVLRKANHFVLFEGLRFGKFGSRKSLANITRDDVRDFFSNVKTSSVLFFSVISDLLRNEVEAKLQRFTQDRGASGFGLKPEMQFRSSKGREAFIFDSPEASNDRLLWTHGGISATDDRRYDLSLILDALGSFEGFLFDLLRNKNGWCYGAYAFLMQPTTRPGRVAYYSDPSATTSALLIPEMLRLLQAFPGEKDFQTRLQERNETFKNRYAYQLDVKYKLISLINYDRYGIPILDRQAYCARIDKVTWETARCVIKEVFDSINLTMVFHGDTKRIQKIIESADSSVQVFTRDTAVLIE